MRVSRGVRTISVPGCRFGDHQRPGSFHYCLHVSQRGQRMSRRGGTLHSLRRCSVKRYQGVRAREGVWITHHSPKLIYVLEEEDNVYEDFNYYYLTQMAAKCTARRLVPDYISEKKMKEGTSFLRGEEGRRGVTFTCMELPFLPDSRRVLVMVNNVARPRTIEPNKPT